MRVGIIAEGRADLAVITNIVKGCLGLDSEHVAFLRPEYSLDQTDLHAQPEEQFSNWEYVRRECRERERIDDFLDSPLDEERAVIIQLDTDVAEKLGVERPAAEPHEDYVAELVTRVAAVMDEWLGAGLDRERIGYAIAVEQTDAWVLALHDGPSRRPASRHRDPKKVLHKALNQPNRMKPKERRRLFQRREYEMYAELSKDLARRSVLVACAGKNRSLRIFLDSLDRWRGDR